MGIWMPGPGETVLARVPVTFATGAAMRVRGRRWFRDEERNDIQGELDGWPAGPVHNVRSTGFGAVLAVLRISALAVGALIVAALPSGSTVKTSSVPRSAADRADELEDFPVLWAAPGTVARSLPWQLDPARSDQRRYRTHLIVTDRRVVIVGLPFNERRCHELPVEDELLWELPRSDIQRVDRQNFKGGDDFKVVFTDGSWCRLYSPWRVFPMQHLADRSDVVPSDALPPEIREAAETFAADHGPDAAPPLVVRNDCGCYRIEVLAPGTAVSFYGIHPQERIVDAEGREVDMVDYHLEDLSVEGLWLWKSLFRGTPASAKASPS
ncbi:hypothetical protein [Streptomyces sp. NPDC057340]|uniref:hypothetical protein n=1 Tax=Streptomyces sp. NPDC057340 TaxID=3346103 RepID=UPI00362C1AEF